MSRLYIENYPPLETLANAETIEGKFLQFRWQGNEYLIFATRDEHQFHNQMLGHFLSDHKVPHHWQDSEHLEVEDTDLSVIGGGRFYFNANSVELELWDNSMAYGRFDETGLADRLKGSGHPFGSGEIVIR